MLFPDNMYEINMHARIHLQWCFSWLTRPSFYLWFIPLPLEGINHPLCLLRDPSSYARGANIHPLSSLASYQLFSPCCLTHPEDTAQIKLHIYIDDITTSAAPSDTSLSHNLLSYKHFAEQIRNLDQMKNKRNFWASIFTLVWVVY